MAGAVSGFGVVFRVADFVAMGSLANCGVSFVGEGFVAAPDVNLEAEACLTVRAFFAVAITVLMEEGLALLAFSLVLLAPDRIWVSNR